MLLNFFIFMMMSINILACMTSNLIYLWILLEMNFMLFIFSMMMSSKKSSTLIVFFLTQSISSLILIYLINLNSILIPMTFMKELFYISMAFKLGLSPFSWWPPMIMKKMNWLLIFSISSFQKFIPFLMIKVYYSLNPSNLLILICLMSLIFSTIKSIFSNNLKVIFAYSSINNSSWMIMLILTDSYSFFLYFTIYTSLLLLFTKHMNNFNLNSMMNLNLMNLNKNKIYLLLYTFSLLFSLSMIPPLCSFIIKLNASMNMIFNNIYIFTLLLMITTTLSIIMYINIIFKTLIFFYFKPKFIYKYTFKSPYIFNILMSIMLFTLIFYLTQLLF